MRNASGNFQPLRPIESREAVDYPKLYFVGVRDCVAIELLRFPVAGMMYCRDRKRTQAPAQPIEHCNNSLPLVRITPRNSSLSEAPGVEFDHGALRLPASALPESNGQKSAGKISSKGSPMRGSGVEETNSFLQIAPVTLPVLAGSSTGAWL